MATGTVRQLAIQGCVLGLLVGALAMSVGSGAHSEITLASVNPPPDLTIATQDGLVTALFSEQTDDAALAAAVPALVSQGVQAVNLRGAPVHDLRPLARLKDLQDLNLAGSQVRDIAPLVGFAALRSLNLQFLRITDLTPIARLTELRTLNIAGTEVRDLSPISHLTNLRQFAAAVTRLRDLTPLAGLRQLTSIDLGSTWVGDVSPLADARMVRFLNLNGTPVEDLQPLANMLLLETLDLGGTRASDVRPLAGLRSLRSLNLEGTFVADITPLTRLPALRTVALGGSRVRDTTPLAHLADTQRPGPDSPALDPIIYWNDQTNRSIQATSMDPFAASRALTMESIAVLDTLKSIDATPAFLVRLPAPRDIQPMIATAAAAHATLVHLFPARRPELDAALQYALAGEPEGPRRARAVAFGEAMAIAVINRREDDGADRTGHVRFGTAPGQWRPTAPNFAAPLSPQWAQLEPFAMTRPDQFRPAGPPELDSEAFKQARTQLREIGALHSTTRTPEQTEIAHYWSDAIGTYAPAGHWNAIAAQIVAPLHLGLAVEAELFAELNVAMADASIAIADAKYAFLFWRPISAIRDTVDPNWLPLLSTPNHPSYVSGHSAFSGAAAAVMTAWFGKRPFRFASDGLPGVSRSFTSFDQAAQEAADSRIYGGIHFPFDNADGLATGRAIGAWTMGVFARLSDDRGPFLMAGGMGMGMGMGVIPGAPADPHAVLGCALDNLSPVNVVSVRLDGGAPFSVPVDEQGFFAVPSHRLPAGRHSLELAATSASGQTSTIRVSIQ